MSAPEGLHLFVCRPSKLQRDVYSSLFIGGSVGGVQRYSCAGRVTDNGDAFLPLLKLLHFVNIGSVHRHAFGRSLLVLDSARSRVAYEAARSACEFGNASLPEMINKMVKRVLWKL